MPPPWRPLWRSSLYKTYPEIWMRSSEIPGWSQVSVRMPISTQLSENNTDSSSIFEDNAPLILVDNTVGKLNWLGLFFGWIQTKLSPQMLWTSSHETVERELKDCPWSSHAKELDTYRKWHAWYRMVMWPMTLFDPERWNCDLVIFGWKYLENGLR